MHARELLEAAQRFADECRIDEAKRAYLAVLRLDPASTSALTGLGRLLLTIGMAADARVVLEAAVQRDPRCADAHRLLVAAFASLGDADAADEHSAREYALRPIHVIPFAGSGVALRVLVVVAAAGINTPTARFFDRRIFEVVEIAPEFAAETAPLPAHDVVFNAIGEAERTPRALAAAQRLIARSDRPVLNHPAAIWPTNRVENAARLAALPGVISARTLRITRAQAADPALARELGLPFLLRVPGHHTGDYFERVDDPAHVDAALARLPGEELLALSFLDARDGAGRYRKFRVLVVDGALYPLHAAVGATWKLHFFSGTHGAAERALDQAFLADPQAVIGKRAMTALRAVGERLELDYGGIDFAVDAAGNVLVFEANATMNVPDTDPDPRFAYRAPALQAVTDAVIRMLITHARDRRR